MPLKRQRVINALLVAMLIDEEEENARYVLILHEICVYFKKLRETHLSEFFCTFCT